MFRSLRLKLAISHAAVLAVILLILGFTGTFLLERRLDTGATNELRDAARAEVEQIQESGATGTPLDADSPSRASMKIAVFDPFGSIVGESTEIPTWLSPQSTGVRDIEVSGETVRLVTVRVQQGGPVATVVAGRSLHPEAELLHHVKVVMVFGGAAAIAFSLVAGWFLAGAAVRPVARAYEAQANFASDASHELRIPLAFVRSGVEVLAERDEELGGQVLEEVDYLASLTGRLLTLARAPREDVGLRLAPIDLTESCRRAVDRSRAVYGDPLRVADAESVVAMADGVSVESVIDAILENVHTHGGGAADISVIREDGKAVVLVADHGPGLPPGLPPERAFERFFRADPSRTRGTGGAGLGLSLARTLIEAQGGKMSLEETPGGGLTARISLPLA